MHEPVTYFDREKREIRREEIYGEPFLRWAYENSVGALAREAVAKRAWFSRWYGWRMSRPGTRARVAEFIGRYGVSTDEMADPPESFASFNAFFRRRLRPGARPVDPDPDHVVFPADGRHLAIPVLGAEEGFFVKGQRFQMTEFLRNTALVEEFRGGSLILSRLCPVDYHRVHAPVSGVVGEPSRINGPLFSVSPIALRRRLAFLWENRRVLVPIRTESWGSVLTVLIGATCVGSVRLTVQPGQEVAKGDEIGYFEFGGSAVASLFVPGAVEPAADLLEHGREGREVYAWCGQFMGSRPPGHPSS